MQIIKRAIVIGNGAAGAENQCIGLLRALGLSDKYTLYVSRFISELMNSDLRTAVSLTDEYKLGCSFHEHDNVLKYDMEHFLRESFGFVSSCIFAYMLVMC